MSSCLLRSILLLTLLCLGGCAHFSGLEQERSVTMVSGNAMPMADGNGQWHQLCFRLAFDANDETDFSLDLILADRVIKPVLLTERQHMPLWRFHRRAAPDATGHQFSFFYFSDADTEERVREMVDANPVLAEIRHRGKLLSLRYDCRSKTGIDEIDALSDPNWDPLIQQTWPSFIMGVSATWLQLIEAISQDMDQTEEDDLFTHYARVEARLVTLWQNQGQHAYLHHLNAIFGYEPLLFRKWMKF